MVKISKSTFERFFRAKIWPKCQFDLSHQNISFSLSDFVIWALNEQKIIFLLKLIYTNFFISNQWKGKLKVSQFYCDFITESFLFGFLNFDIAERITLKAVLTSFIKHLFLTLFLSHRGILMGIIQKKTNNYTAEKK